jgi:WD40 repeat protein
MLGSYQNITGRVTAHDSMITCIDAYDHLLASGGLDKKVAIWDLRTLDSNGLILPIKKITVDDNAILKVAIGLSNNVAVSTLKGLSLIDFAGSATPKQAIPFKDQKPPGRYHDLKWNTNKSVLFAAGDDMRIDQYILK